MLAPPPPGELAPPPRGNPRSATADDINLKNCVQGIHFKSKFSFESQIQINMHSKSIQNKSNQIKTKQNIF